MAESRNRIYIKKAISSISFELRKELLKACCEELLGICAHEQQKKKREVWIRDWMSKRNLGASETILRELYDNDPHEYRALMRLTPEQFEQLLLMVSPMISCNDTLMRKSLPARLKLEITLAFLASGTNFRMLSVMFRVSKPSISNMIPQVCDALYFVLKEYMKVSVNNYILNSLFY